MYSRLSATLPAILSAKMHRTVARPTRALLTGLVLLSASATVSAGCGIPSGRVSIVGLRLMRRPRPRLTATQPRHMPIA